MIGSAISTYSVASPSRPASPGKPRFEQAAPFRGGLALVVEDGGKSYSYVNRDGQTVYSFPRVPKEAPED